MIKLYEEYLRKVNPEMPMLERFALVTEKVRNDHPLQDHTPRQTYKGSNNSATFGNKQKTKTTFDYLPRIDQLQAASLIKKGIYKDKADYLASQRILGLIT